MEELISILIVAFAILQLILFFKIWGLTNTVKEIENIMIRSSLQWANNVTDAEKKAAMPLMSKLNSDMVIVKICITNELEIWEAKRWEAKQNLPNYKLIYTY